MSPRARAALLRHNLLRLPFRYRVDAKTGCWIWEGVVNAQGFPITYMHRAGVKNLWPARRVAWLRSHRTIPRGKMITQTCSNPLCVRHLGAFTQAELSQRGANAKITAADAVRIRRLVAAGGDMSDIGAKHGISGAEVSNINTRKRWRNVA